MKSKRLWNNSVPMEFITEEQITKWHDALEQVKTRAFAEFRPPKKLTVSEWADSYRVIPSGASSRPGNWQTDFVPYMRKIMDSYEDENIDEIVFLKATQIGGTEAAINMVGYTIDQHPRRLLYVMPDEDTFREFSDERLQPMLRGCSCFKGKFNENDSRDGFLKFRGGFCKLTTANSPSKLASLSIPYIIMDEIDKYPKWSGKEANPIKLARERAKNWSGMAKLILLSTPTVKEGNIYRAYEGADVKYKYYVPCPHCGKMQPLEWSGIKYDSKQHVTEIEYNTHYECCECHGIIRDHHKPDMLKKGRWIAQNTCAGRPKKIGFSINSIYSPWVTFGMVAAEFVRSKDDPADLMNFVNSWLGQPWEQSSASLDVESVLQQRTEVPGGVVPRWAQLLTGGVDVQKGYFFWTIRAWGAGITSQNIAYGTAETWEELEKVMDTFWPVDNDQGEKLQVDLYCVDSGYRTEEVYLYCNDHPGIAVAVKGSSSPMTAKYRITNVEPKSAGVAPTRLYIVDTDQYKNIINARMMFPVNRPGAWMLHADTEEVYAEHLTSEWRKVSTKNGKVTEHWEKKTSAKQNHWWDCEVYAALAATLRHVSLLTDEEEEGEDADYS